MSFDPTKITEVETMTSTDFAVWRTSKQNEVIYKRFIPKIRYVLFRSLLRKQLGLHSITPPGP